MRKFVEKMKEIINHSGAVMNMIGGCVVLLSGIFLGLFMLLSGNKNRKRKVY